MVRFPDSFLGITNRGKILWPILLFKEEGGSETSPRHGRYYFRIKKELVIDRCGEEIEFRIGLGIRRRFVDRKKGF